MNIPSASVPTRYGDFDLKIFTGTDGIEHIVLVKGKPKDDCLVRLHSECATGDIFGSLRCDCRDQLEKALRMIEEEGCGVLIYIRGHEGRGIGLSNKIRAYTLQDKGLDTYEANVELGFAPDERDYSDAINILKHFGLKSVRLLSNNPEKLSALKKAGIEVSEKVPMWLATNPHNERYIAAKKKKMS